MDISEGHGKRESLFQKILRIAIRNKARNQTPYVRNFNPKTDIDSLLYWQEDLFTANFSGFQMNPYFLLEQKKRLLEAASNPEEQGIFVIDLNQGEIGGFIWCKVYDTNEYGIFGSVEEIYLIPGLRGKGYGRKLMEKGEEYFLSRKAKSIKLLVTVANSAAVNLYRALGYKVARWEMQKEIM